MIINLKQPEIEQALRAYVAAQGISLVGKDLSIAFTAGRRESGISAEISIEISIDAVEIPGYTNDLGAPEYASKATIPSIAPAAVTETPVPQEPLDAEPGEVPAIAEEATEIAPKTPVSLFG